VKKLIVYGAGGLGREIKSMLTQCTVQYQLIGFLDDGLPQGSVVDGVPVMGGVNWLANCPQDVRVVIAIGDPKTKQKVLDQVKSNWKVEFATLQHNRSVVQNTDTVQIGRGSVLCAGSVLTTGIIVGDHVLINLNATIGHDSVIGDCSSIMPNASIAGEVRMGKGVMIGSGANVINRMNIGDDAIIGAGSVVNHDVAAGATAAGVPARSIK
jgi:sugar O-acyltransferase (sialic acid O-acetyltransferase NeuD family)